MAKENVQKKQQNAVSATQRYLPIAEIHDDTVLLKDGSVRAVIDVTSINFGLKSEQEQDAIIYSYQNFLNALEYPIQIVIRSKKLDIDDYLASLEDVVAKQTNQLLKNQTYQYMNFIEKLVEYADIMEKKFYVIIPYDGALGGTQKNVFKQFLDTINPDDSLLKYKGRMKYFNSMKKGLLQRVNVTQAGLENCGLKTKLLTTKELIELYYNIYNPLTSMEQKLKDVNINTPKKKQP